MKVIVTGSEGFIGRALCESLNRSGVEIVRIDKVLGSDAADMERVAGLKLDVIARFMPEKASCPCIHRDEMLVF